jgi:hypothetical protein
LSRLACPAGQAGVDDDVAAEPRGVDPGADRGDDAGDVAAEHVRERIAQAAEVVADPQVEAVERDGVDVDDCLAGAGGRVGELGWGEGVGAAGGVEDDGAHGSGLGAGGPWRISGPEGRGGSRGRRAVEGLGAGGP